MKSTGKQLRDAGMNAVLSNNVLWMLKALDRIAALPIKWTGSGEDIRIIVGIKPSHHNAWGGLINSAIANGLIEATGNYVHMTLPKSHGRRTPEYRRGPGHR